ncbi:MAG: hypothetical protein HQK54_00085 [Oligoflexales bacterium]|nr:hypothetical protein [Oligoflexales bacterium]
MIRLLSVLMIFFVSISCDGRRGSRDLSLNTFFSDISEEPTGSAWDSSEFDVLFTNPVCPFQEFVSYKPRGGYAFKEIGDKWVYPSREEVKDVTVPVMGIPTVGGEFRKGIPPNVYCTNKDFAFSTKRLPENSYRKKENPMNRIEDWISRTREQDEIFLASFSFTSRQLKEWLCAAAKERGVKVKVLINVNEDGSPTVDAIKSECPEIEMIEASSSARLAHLKFMLVFYNNSNHDEKIRKDGFLSFQTANVSFSGFWAHHETWNFVRKDRSNWFIQDHICLRDAITRETMENMLEFSDRISKCRSEKGINSRREPSLVSNYFIPVSGGEYNDKVKIKEILEEIGRAKTLKIAAHHIAYEDIYEALIQRLKNAENDGFTLEIVIDSQIFWTGYTKNKKIVVDDIAYFSPDDYTGYCHYGKKNDSIKRSCSMYNISEFYGKFGLKRLISEGARVRYFESNHRDYKFFHNKFIISEYKSPEGVISGSVFVGAGNFSKAAFERNLENYYLIKIPHVYEEYKKQFDYLFSLAVEKDSLPITWDYAVKAQEYSPAP